MKGCHDDMLNGGAVVLIYPNGIPIMMIVTKVRFVGTVLRKNPILKGPELLLGPQV